nr:MAG TPA: hypothetical protein [Caudoviricetes sp.]
MCEKCPARQPLRSVSGRLLHGVAIVYSCKT